MGKGIYHSKPVGKGENAFKYLSNYVYRITISNNRILKCENGMVTFRYKESKTDETKYQTVSALEFMRRFLQHVLPDGFQKVRYYGFMSSAAKQLFERIKLVLLGKQSRILEVNGVPFKPERAVYECPECAGKMRLIAVFPRQKIGPPITRKPHPNRAQFD